MNDIKNECDCIIGIGYSDSGLWMVYKSSIDRIKRELIDNGDTIFNFCPECGVSLGGVDNEVVRIDMSADAIANNTESGRLREANAKLFRDHINQPREKAILKFLSMPQKDKDDNFNALKEMYESTPPNFNKELADKLDKQIAQNQKQFTF